MNRKDLLTAAHECLVAGRAMPEEEQGHVDLLFTQGLYDTAKALMDSWAAISERLGNSQPGYYRLCAEVPHLA